MTLTVVRIERASPAVPLPPQTEWTVSFEKPRGGQGGLPDTTIRMQDEMIVRSRRTSESPAIASTYAQKLLAESDRYPEPEDVEIEVAEELVIRYIGYSQIEALRQRESLPEGPTSPVGVLVHDRERVEPRREPPCTVTLSLGNADRQVESSETAAPTTTDETSFTITEESGW